MKHRLGVHRGYLIEIEDEPGRQVHKWVFTATAPGGSLRHIERRLQARPDLFRGGAPVVIRGTTIPTSAPDRRPVAVKYSDDQSRGWMHRLIDLALDQKRDITPLCARSFNAGLSLPVFNAMTAEEFEYAERMRL